MTTSEVEPRWLTDDERRAWIALSGLMALLPAALDTQSQRDAGLTLFEYQVLSRLSMADGRTLRMGELATITNGSLSRLSNVAKRLEARGWIRRRPDPCDGRGTVAELLEDGWQQVVAAAPAHVAEVRRLVIDGLSAAQLRVLAEIGEDVAGRVCGSACPPAG